ncbi:MAG TPA: response regulator transcription factor [Paraburkholderia sp.]|jgi:DNA-binding response OmpR family regulator|uniref:response regulator transcription factor n=1 Tax=Paraburkholderia sp. TaxID=1926495 RepID=UPI002DE8ABA8|nr:response regulator transcription factor [Paraburkholderia sp.]
MRLALLSADAELVELASRTLPDEGCVCHHFAQGSALLRALRRETFDLLVLDHALPDMAGIRVLSTVRAIVSMQIPVLYVTSLYAERDEISALNAGADACINRPVDAVVLRARVAAVLRRASSTGLEYTDENAGAFEFDPVACSVSRNGITIQLTARQFRLALLFYQHVGTTLSREHILDLIWIGETDVNMRSVDTQISRLRAKLHLAPESGYRLTAVHGRGYRLDRL